MTPPEQGGFNEKLEEILDDFGNQAVNGVNKYNLNFKTRAVIRSLVLEEIIGEDFKYWGELETDEQAQEAAKNRLRAEQRKKLGGTNGTK